MHPKAAAIIRQRGPGSLMNLTRWRELATAMQALQPVKPQISVKCLDADAALGPSLLDWEAFIADGPELGEWMLLHAKLEQPRGRLLTTQIIDLRVAIESALGQCRLPFSSHEAGCRVWGQLAPPPAARLRLSASGAGNARAGAWLSRQTPSAPRADA